ncbi:NUDIX hydrolase [Allorhizocola rhizosphaerae]|uniref:NUDIX hydrolase n=1 Tax=Allorhizocola rhizosphaerae TaxID=1872709 RepID=UPI000E3C0462|nr:NUDIX domain-containing protein [Allorhizocola rhizosphaerae]
METRHRPAVRVVCLDASQCILLLRWRDPFDGAILWEPPGGGIEPGESPLEAARRELVEETGLDPAAIGERWIDVERDIVWNGSRFAGPEQFFLARFSTDRPAVVQTGLLPDEQPNLLAAAWIPLSGLDALPDRLEPPNLVEILGKLGV